jgi:hypothetical protein
MYLITFIIKIFSFTFSNKFVEIYQLFPCKKAYYVKRQKKIQNFSGKICFLWSRYGAGTGTGTGTGTFQK